MKSTRLLLLLFLACSAVAFVRAQAPVPAKFLVSGLNLTGNLPPGTPTLVPIPPVYETFVVPVANPETADAIRRELTVSHYHPRIAVRIAVGGDGSNLNYYASPARPWSWRCTELIYVRTLFNIPEDPLNDSLPARAIQGSASEIEVSPQAFLAQNGDIIYFHRFRVVAELKEGATSVVKNLSLRGTVGTGENALIGGFVVTGDKPKQAVVRVIGPSLRSYGIANPLSATRLEIVDQSGQTIASNTTWAAHERAHELTVRFPHLQPTNAKESAILLELTPGSYTTLATGVNGATGVALVEVYLVNDF